MGGRDYPLLNFSWTRDMYPHNVKTIWNDPICNRLNHMEIGYERFRLQQIADSLINEKLLYVKRSIQIKRDC